MTTYAEDLSRAFGFLKLEEVELIKLIAKKMPPEAKIVNLGAGVGTSSLAIVEQRPDLAGTLWTVDISQEGPLGGLDNEVHAFSPTGLKLPNQILGDALAIGKDWSTTLDWLLVDDDHTPSHVLEECKFWLPWLRVGGVVCFHDYDPVMRGGLKLILDDLVKKLSPSGKPKIAGTLISVTVGKAYRG